eukprot:s1851_g2.t5
MTGPSSAGLTLTLRLPGNREEVLSVREDDLGSKVWSSLKTLAALHRFPAPDPALTPLRRPDGQELSLDQPLRCQGLRDGSLLVLAELPPPPPRVHEKVVVTSAEFALQQEEDAPRPSLTVSEPSVWPKEVREDEARRLKEQANSGLKEGRFADARDLYSSALAWLPPAESDPDLAAALFANRALAQVKLQRWDDARADCEQSLRLAPGSAKVHFRLGLAWQNLGDPSAAAANFRAALDKEPDDRAAKQALVSATAAATKPKSSEDGLPTSKDVPKGLRWRLARCQEGYELPRLQQIWRDLGTDTASPSGISAGSAAAAGLRHAWRLQRPLVDFYRCSLEAFGCSQKPGLHVVILGAGSLAASRALREAEVATSLALVEPSPCLAAAADSLLDHKATAVQSSGQLDTGFAIPAAAFAHPHSQETATCLLVCDRLSDDLLGERLVATMKAGMDVAKRKFEKVLCLPGRAELVCAPLELRSGDCLGIDVAKVNALRFSGQAVEAPAPGARPWQCTSCSWRNVPQIKNCELCRAQRQKRSVEVKPAARCESLGWWPINLDRELEHEERSPGGVCRLCGEEKVVCTFDFSDAAAFEEQQRVVERTFETTITCDCRMNALAVWWRLSGPDGLAVDTRPFAPTASRTAWGGSKHQAVFFLGYEIGLAAGEVVKFRLRSSDLHSRIHFEQLSPNLTERMGLVKFEVDITNTHILAELKSKLDLRTNRLLGPVAGTPLKRRDKLLRFGPFDVAPGTLSPELWRKVEERMVRHAERPKRGDEPVRCVFRHGIFEGTVRWPTPPLGEGAVVPRLPSYFHSFRDLAARPYQEAMARFLAPAAGGRRPRVLELNCGPVPLLSIAASQLGARAWAQEALPHLRDLALEAVREQGLEMVFDRRGLANYSFFGAPRTPDDAAVRVLKACPSTSLEVSSRDPKFLDCAGADLLLCRPDPSGPLALDYLEVMCHAKELLSPGGRLIPDTLSIKVAAVAGLEFVDETLSPLGHGPTEAALADLQLLSDVEAALTIDLTRSMDGQLPTARGVVTVTQPGRVSGLAYWHQPAVDGEELGRADGGCYVSVSLAQPRVVAPGDRIPFVLAFEEFELMARVAFECGEIKNTGYRSVSVQASGRSGRNWMKLPTSIGSVRCRCWDSSPTAEAVEEAEAEQEQRRQHQQKRQWQTTAKAIEAAEAAGDEEDERRRGGAEGMAGVFMSEDLELSGGLEGLDPCSSLALHPGSGGWTSARACTYPQEILLQLPRGAEIHEVEVAAPFPLAPRAVDVFLSAGSREDRLAGNPNFQHVCSLELRGVGSKPSRLLKAKHKFFGLCTGQVRLLIHEPVATGSENPYKQVALATVDLWGYEDVLPETSGPLPLDLGEHHEDIASVLMELGVPLNLVPVSGGLQPTVHADAATCSLIRELRDKEDQLIRERLGLSLLVLGSAPGDWG